MKARRVWGVSCLLLLAGLVAALVSCGEDEWGDGNGVQPNPRDRDDTGGGSDGGASECPPDCAPGPMVAVAASAFDMGCNEAVDQECFDNEHPVHGVSVPAFQIDKFEVTAGGFEGCVAAGACAAPTMQNPACTYDQGAKANHPLTCVTWDQANNYCVWAGKRLPTEAEWELAARGTDGRRYPWGNDPVASCTHAVMRDVNVGIEGCNEGGTMPVGSKPAGASPFGAYDMVGNAWEWVEDNYQDNYMGAPNDGSAWLASNPDTHGRVLRGGGYDDSNDKMRASVRTGGAGGLEMVNVGFRCAK